MIESMVYNFKRAVNKASQLVQSGSMSNVTTSSTAKPISLIGGVTNKPGHNEKQQLQQRVTIEELQIDGLNSPKVSNVYVNKKNMKLHVVFNFKNIKVSGKCVVSSKQQQVGAGGQPQSPVLQQPNKILLEATNWNASWSANVMQMIGREHFDMNRVYTSHSQQRLSLNLKECPQALHDRLKAALLERVRVNIDARLVDIMETVIMRTDTLSDDAITGATSLDESVAAAATAASRGALSKPTSRGKRASPSAELKALSADGPIGSSSRESNPLISSKMGLGKSKRQRAGAGAKKALKRTKRQTPCQQGEELDDYVDQLFRFGQRIVRAMEPVSTPNATIELPDYNLKIFLYDGKATRAYKFKRAKPAWVFCSNETISLGITIELEDLRVAYKYRVISGNRLLFDGDLEAKLSPKAQAQFSQAVQEEDSEEPVQQRIDRVRLFRLGRVNVIIRGLGNLTQSLSMIINSYLNDNQEELQPTFRMVEGDAVRMLNRFLANVNVPLLSVV